MKKIQIMFLCSLILNGATLSHNEITNMVNKIKHKREGIDVSSLKNTPNPFALVEKVEKKIEKKVEKKVEKKIKTKVIKREEEHELTAVLNHSAFIDGKWYKIGDKVGTFTLISINYDSVDIKYNNKQKKLSIKKKKKKIMLRKGN